MIAEELVTDRTRFETLRDEGAEIIDFGRRLPQVVFKRAFHSYYVIEQSHVFNAEFGGFLSRIADICGDLRVNYLTIEPDAEDYYYRHYSFFGLATFDSVSLSQRYVPVMSRDGHVDSFRSRGGDVGAFWGSSLQWGIFSDRISWEIALIAVPAAVDVREISDFRVLDRGTLAEYEGSQYRWNRRAASQFCDAFLKSYRI
jgi:hypothetical protein